MEPATEAPQAPNEAAPTTGDLVEKLNSYHKHRKAKEDFAAQASAEGKKADAFAAEIIAMSKKLRLARLPSILGFPSYKVVDKISVKTLDKAAVVKWAEEKGYKGQLSMNANTLGALVREIQEDRERIMGEAGDDETAQFEAMKKLPTLPEGISISEYSIISK